MLLFYYKKHPLIFFMEIFDAVPENRETNKYVLPTK